MTPYISDGQWTEYETQGYLRLGQVMDENELAGLQQRIDEIMMGTASTDYDRITMQLDRDPAVGGDKPGPQSRGHKIATLCYRKIQGLEFDPLFLSFMQKPVFEEISERVYGAGTSVACFRAMFMNKPAREGTPLVWHQDRWTDLDLDPQITIWTALDPATPANGCVKIMPGSHDRLINPTSGSGFWTEEQTETVVAENEIIDLEVALGESVLLHNWMLHSSGTNNTDIARRAFSACYINAATQSRSGHTFSLLFGEGALQSELV